MSGKAQTGELFRPFDYSEMVIPVSTLDNPVWHHDGAELSLAVKGKSPSYNGDEAIIWISLEERNWYCDRGHYLMKIHAGGPALCLDAADFRPNYYMRLDVAKQEIVEWLRWRTRKERAEPYGQIRDQQPQNHEREKNEGAAGLHCRVPSAVDGDS